MKDVEELSLATLLSGAVVERVDDELAKVLLNVVDPATPATAQRTVTLKLTIKPEKDRSMGSVLVAVSSKLAGVESMDTRLFISMTKAGPVATEYNLHQPALPNISEPNNIVPLQAVGGSK